MGVGGYCWLLMAWWLKEGKGEEETEEIISIHHMSYIIICVNTSMTLIKFGLNGSGVVYWGCMGLLSPKDMMELGLSGPSRSEDIFKKNNLEVFGSLEKPEVSTGVMWYPLPIPVTTHFGLHAGFCKNYLDTLLTMNYSSPAWKQMPD